MDPGIDVLIGGKDQGSELKDALPDFHIPLTSLESGRSSVQPQSTFDDVPCGPGSTLCCLTFRLLHVLLVRNDLFELGQHLHANDGTEMSALLTIRRLRILTRRLDHKTRRSDWSIRRRSSPALW